jgi:hypothetical protein
LEVVISLSKLKTTSEFLAGQWLVNGWSVAGQNDQQEQQILVGRFAGHLLFNFL